VWLVVTETGLHSAVTRGENAGEDLHHAAVVRSMRKIGEAKADGETSFTGDASVSYRKNGSARTCGPWSSCRKKRAAGFWAPQRFASGNRLSRV